MSSSKSKDEVLQRYFAVSSSVSVLIQEGYCGDYKKWRSMLRLCIFWFLPWWMQCWLLPKDASIHVLPLSSVQRHIKRGQEKSGKTWNSLIRAIFALKLLFIKKLFISVCLLLQALKLLRTKIVIILIWSN